MNVPVIRLEVQGMKQTVYAALREAAAEIDEDIRQSIEQICTPENIARIVNETVKANLDAILKEEVRSFLCYGKGRIALREAFQQRLEEMYPSREGEGT